MKNKHLASSVYMRDPSMKFLIHANSAVCMCMHWRQADNCMLSLCRQNAFSYANCNCEMSSRKHEEGFGIKHNEHGPNKCKCQT